MNGFSVKLNGIELNEYLKVTEGFNRGIGTSRENDSIQISKSNFRKYRGYRLDSKTIDMPFTLKYNLIEKRRKLAQILNVSEPVRLIFGDEPNKYYLAVPKGDTNVDEKNFLGSGTITWFIPDGVAHAVEETETKNYEDVDVSNLVFDSNFEGGTGQYYSSKCWRDEWVVVLNGFDKDASLLKINKSGYQSASWINAVNDRVVKVPVEDADFSFGCWYKVDKADEDGMAETLYFVIQEFDINFKKVAANPLSEARIPGNSVVGQWYKWIKEGYKIQNQATKYIAFMPFLRKNGIVSIAKPQFNSGEKLSGYTVGTNGISSILRVDNKGTSDSYPTYEIEFRSDCGYVLLTDQEKGVMFGNPEEVDQVNTYKRERSIHDEFYSLSKQWKVNEQLPLPTNGLAVGSYNAENSHLKVNDYGAGEGWHGPLLSQAISGTPTNCTIQHYHVMQVIDLDPRNRIEIAMYDKEGKRIACLGLIKNANNDKVVPYHYIGDEIQSYTDGIGSSYSKFWGLLHLEKKGDTFTFRITPEQKGGYLFQQSIKSPDFADIEVKTVAIWMAKYGEYRAMSNFSAELIDVYTDNAKYEQDLLNSFTRGDKLVIDYGSTDLDGITLNGLPYLQIGDIGNDFSPLEPGETNIIIAYSDWALPPKVKMKYRETYL